MVQFGSEYYVRQAGLEHMADARRNYTGSPPGGGGWGGGGGGYVKLLKADLRNWTPAYLTFA